MIRRLVTYAATAFAQLDLSPRTLAVAAGAHPEAPYVEAVLASDWLDPGQAQRTGAASA